MLSTGSPLAPESFDYVYATIKPDLHLASISGGTDIVSLLRARQPDCCRSGAARSSAAALGMTVEVFDDDGQPVRGEKGELVCTRAVSRRCRSASGTTPTARKYHAAYFERFPDVWCHGDFAELTAHGGMIIYGRSDAMLNPGGVRIGTAEIYRQVEQLRRGGRERSSSARTGTTTCASCCSCGCATA